MGRAGVWRVARTCVCAWFLAISWLVLPSMEHAGTVRANSFGVRVPILAYHNIDHSGSGYSTTPEMLEAQLIWLQTNGYTAISIWQFWDAMTGGATLPANPILLTNDDGWESAVTFAAILGRHGMVGNYFINNYSPLTPDQILLLAQNGPVQAHTASHQHMSQLGYDAQLAEIADNKAYIEGITGLPVRFVAWPFGDWNSSAVEAAVAAGLIGGLGLGGTGCVVGGVDMFNVPRIMMEAPDTIDTFAAKVSSW
jgi:peptidoglycan/xylan/chitin deacetylase (PgdA/CDA1 family)